MPHRQLPNSTPSVVRTLKAAQRMWKLSQPTERALTADQWSLLNDADPNSLINRFLKEVSEVDLAQAAQAPLTSGVAIAAGRLTMHVSHFHQVLDLGIARGTFANGARKYYGRDINATAIPSLTTYAEVLTEANNIVTGEAARATAEAAGVAHFDDGTTYDSGATYAPDGSTGPTAHVPMAMPSAAEVGLVRDRFTALRDEVTQAEVNTNREQEEAMALYPDAQALAVDICDTVEFYYRKDPDAASRRAKCTEWGVVYLYDTNEPQPPAPPPTNPTPPTP